MPLVEVLEGRDAERPLFIGEFDFLPRKGQYLAYDAGGYFRYYDVVEVWHRQDGEGGRLRATILVELDD